MSDKYVNIQLYQLGFTVELWDTDRDGEGPAIQKLCLQVVNATLEQAQAAILLWLGPVPKMI